MKEKSALISFLQQHMTAERIGRFEEVLRFRTRYITVAAEDTYQERNASALVRTADCFGIQDVHIIENHNKYKISDGITKGADKWVNVHVYDGEGRNTDKCIKTLRDHGYRIVAASPHKEEYGPEDMDITTKFALFLGGEKEGLSESVIREADAFLRIPMVGFTESFNLSVAGGILLYTLTQRLRRSGIEWELSPEEKDELRLAWAMKSVPRAEQLIRKFQQLT